MTARIVAITAEEIEEGIEKWSLRDHFCADENYYGGEALMEEAEAGKDIGEGEVKGAEAEDGENI